MLLECGDAFDDPGASALDACEGDLSLGISTSGTVDTAAPGVYMLNYDVSDSAGNAALTVQRKVTVLDTQPPVIAINGLPIVEVVVGDSFVDPGAVALDVCGGDLTPSIVLSGVVDVLTLGSYTLEYTATDASGNSASVERTVNVVANTPPTLTLLGGAVLTADCGEPFVDPGALALDEQDGDISGHVQVTGAIDVTARGTYELTYTVTDRHGLSAAPVVRTVLVSDRKAPDVTVNGPLQVVLSCGTIYEDAGGTAVDACDGPVDVTINTSLLDTNTAGIYFVAVSAVDSSGNGRAVLRTISVVDDAAPTMTLFGPNPLALECGTDYIEFGAAVFDACDLSLDTFSVDLGSLDTTVEGTYAVTYTAADASGNSTVLVREVVVQNCETLETCLAACALEETPVDSDGDGLTDCEEACHGTEPSNPDTDGDGMADSFEVLHGLNPLADDADEDPDADDFTNLEEFLRNSDPNDPTSPSRVFFVAPDGVDIVEGGSQAAPWQTIAFALSQAASSVESPARINLFSGIYEEDVVLQPSLILASALNNSATVRGSIIGAEGATLEALSIEAVGDTDVLLSMEDVALRVAGCAFVGTPARLAIGIVTIGSSLGTSIIEQSTFSNLAVGIDISGDIPIIRRCVFQDLSGSGIVIRGAGSKQDTRTIGDITDPGSGWNNFNTPTIDGFAIVNGTGQTLVMENNEWGTEDPNEIQTVISGDADFEPFLPLGNAILAASLFCTLWDADDQQPIENASVTILPSSYAPVTANDRGVYAFPAIADGTYTVNCTAPGYQTITHPVQVAPAGLHSAIIPMPKSGAEGEGEGEGEKNPPACSAGEKGAGGGAGDLLLLGALTLALLAPSARRRNAILRKQ
jgi:hypothetical protein